MLDVLAWSGGELLKFAGDATLVYFPEQENGSQAQWAVRAGQRMLQAIRDFENIETPTEKVSLKMKIGVASGNFIAASIGSATRMEYAVFGPAISRTMAAEGASTQAGQLIIDENTNDLLDEAFQSRQHKPGFYSVAVRGENLGEFEIKAEQRRARGAMPWNASPQAIVAQMDVALRQIKAISPFLAPELVERIVVHAQQRRVDSEFRPIIILFCNFTGLEELFDLWGQEGI